jgi:hypothetical protein
MVIYALEIAGVEATWKLSKASFGLARIDKDPGPIHGMEWIRIRSVGTNSTIEKMHLAKVCISSAHSPST